VLATVLHPFSPLVFAELAEEHVMVENWSLQFVWITELGLFALSYPEHVNRKFNVAVVATVFLELSRRSIRGLFAFLRPSSRERVPGEGPSWIPNWIGLLYF
jgi:hypothetical protein